MDDITMGRQPTRLEMTDRKRQRREVVDLLALYLFDFDPEALVGTLPR